MASCSVEAWNNFVLWSEASAYEKDSVQWAAATANRYMGSVNSGGLNSFLSQSWDLDAQDVVDALHVVGAQAAAKQLEYVLQRLGVPLPVSSQQERWDAVGWCWKDELDPIDCLSDEAEAELMVALQAHVANEEDFYVELGAGRTNTADLEDRPASDRSYIDRLRRFLRRVR